MVPFFKCAVGLAVWVLAFQASQAGPTPARRSRGLFKVGYSSRGEGETVNLLLSGCVGATPSPTTIFKRPSGVMAAAADSKSAEVPLVWVRVPPWPPFQGIVFDMLKDTDTRDGK